MYDIFRGLFKNKKRYCIIAFMKITYNKVTAAVLVLAVSLLVFQFIPGITPRSSELDNVSENLLEAVEAIDNEKYDRAVNLLEGYPEVREIDVNPVVMTSAGPLVIDARVVTR